MRFESAMSDMRAVTTHSALGFLFCAIAAAVPARAQSAEPSACVAATGPDVPRVTRDSAAAREGLRARSDSLAVGRHDATTSATNPTVRLLASVHADEVRFAAQPRICVRLRGDAQLDSVHVVERRNIRSPVAVGTTYRDVYVAVEILGHLNAQCISARITGQPATGACASLQVRDSAAARGSASPGGSP